MPFPPGRRLLLERPARGIDRAVAALFLDSIKPPEIERALAVVREAERQGSEVDRQWTLRLERARYEAQLARRTPLQGQLRCPGCGGRRRIVGVYAGGLRLRELLERLGLGERSSRPPPGGASRVR